MEIQIIITSTSNESHNSAVQKAEYTVSQVGMIPGFHRASIMTGQQDTET